MASGSAPAGRVFRLLSWAALAIGLGMAGLGGARLWLRVRQDEAIDAILAGRDRPVALDASAPVLAAWARALIAMGRLDAAQAVADRLTAAPASLQETLFYDLGNARLRHGLDLFKQVPFRVVAPILSLAKAEYRRALTLDPWDWDARYNYTLAAALVRDTEAAQPTAGDQMSHERAAWPDIPGAPNGLP